MAKQGGYGCVVQAGCRNMPDGSKERSNWIALVGCDRIGGRRLMSQNWKESERACLKEGFGRQAMFVGMMMMRLKKVRGKEATLKSWACPASWG